MLTKFSLSFAAAVAALVLVTERPVYAYIDPGAGSLIYQAALTVVLGVALVLRRSRESIVRFMRRLSGREVASDRTRTDGD